MTVDRARISRQASRADYYDFHSYKVYPSGARNVIEFEDTYKSFGPNQILRGPDHGSARGHGLDDPRPLGHREVDVCIKHMSVGLLYAPDSGDVLDYDGESVPNMTDDRLFEMRKKFGLLFQDGALFSSMNLYDNVAFPLRQHTEKSEQEIEEIVMRAPQGGWPPGNARATASPTSSQAACASAPGSARALVLGPDIVLFDEPDSRAYDPVRTGAARGVDPRDPPRAWSRRTEGRRGRSTCPPSPS